MTIPRSKAPPRRSQTLMRFFFTFTVTTTMIATGGFGAFEKNPITDAFQQEIGQNIPEDFLRPVNLYLNQLSAPTIQPQFDSNPNPPLDPIGFLLGDVPSDPAPALIKSGPGEETSTPPTEAGTQTITPTPSTQTGTPTRTPTRTPSPTLTPTPILTTAADCSVVSTAPATTTFFNSSSLTIDVYWVDFSCNLVLYATLTGEQSSIQETYIGYRWWFINSATGHLIADYVVSSANDIVDVSTSAVITSTPTPPPAPTAFLTSTSGPTVLFNYSAVDINGSGSSAVVVGGEPFSVTYNFNIWDDPCPGCISQLVTGLGSSGTHADTCAFNGSADLYPGTAGSENVTLIAPETAGTYNVLAVASWQYTCNDALIAYPSGSSAPQVIGQITVP